MLSNTAGSITSSVAAVVVTQPVRIPRPQVTSIAPFGDDEMGFLYFGSAGRTYHIQASTDLIQWGNIATNGMAAEINLFIDTNASQYRSRFYRVTVAQ